MPSKVASSHYASGDSKREIKPKTDAEEAMDTGHIPAKPVGHAPAKPADPFAGLLADMKSSIQKAPSFKKSPTKGSGGSSSSSEAEGPRSDRAQTFPQINSNAEDMERSPRGHQPRSSSVGQANSKNVNSGSDSQQPDDGMATEEEDDDATQLEGDFQYTQSGSPTFWFRDGSNMGDQFYRVILYFFSKITTLWCMYLIENNLKTKTKTKQNKTKQKKKENLPIAAIISQALSFEACECDSTPSHA